MADLDRLLTLTVRGPLVYDDVELEYVDGSITFEGKVWCRQVDVGSGQEVVSGALRIVEYRNFTIRYRQDVTSVGAAGQLAVTDDDGNGWTINRVSETDERRRFMNLECTRMPTVDQV